MSPALKLFNHSSTATHHNVLILRRQPLFDRNTLMQDRRWRHRMECNIDKTCELQGYNVKISDFGLAKLIADGT